MYGYINRVMYDFIIGTIKMTFINIRTGFWVLLMVAKICETWSYDPVAPSVSNQNRIIYHDLISMFNTDGSIRIEGIEKFYGIRGNRRFVSGPHGYRNDRLNTSEEIRIEIDNPLDPYINVTLFDDDWIEQYLANIEILNLEGSQLRNLSSDQFHWQSNTTLKILNMRFTHIKNVAEDALGPVRETLKVLDLSNANISVNDVITLMKSLALDGIESVPALRILSLASLGLTTIPKDALESVQYSLLALSLFGNDFGTVYKTTATEKNESTAFKWDDYWDNELVDSSKSEISFLNRLLDVDNKSSGSPWANFPSMPFLIQLDLRYCNINSIMQDTFQNLGNLKKLLLSNNGILTVENYAFDGLRNLMSLDLSFNDNALNVRKNARLKISEHSFTGLLSLTTLNLSNTFLHPSTSNYLSRLPSSLITLDLRRTRLEALNAGIFERLNNLQFLDISNNFRLCSEVNTESFTGLNMLQELYMSRTSLSDLGVLENLSLLKRLDAKYNKLNTFVNVLENFPLLEHLDVGHNYISSWSNGRAFASNRKLKGVFLHGNILTLMTENMLEDFKSLSYMTLANNSFVCNCPLKEFMEYYEINSSNTNKFSPLLIAYNRDDGSHICTDLTLSKTIRFEDTDEYCIDERIIIWLSTVQHIVYIVILILISCASIGTLIYWKWWYIRYVAVMLKNVTVLSIINVENCEDRVYVYDIFVSYSDANRNWVIEELIPNIEGPEGSLSICLHERDFQVGVSILENIITKIDQSRTILLVISSFFIKSQWCQFEMHMAQHRLIETCREELILILLEEIPRENRCKILQYLMMVKTYIVWPKDSEDEDAKKLFWKRLRKAITTNKSKLIVHSLA